jgi:hypothetical protein
MGEKEGPLRKYRRGRFLQLTENALFSHPSHDINTHTHTHAHARAQTHTQYTHTIHTLKETTHSRRLRVWTVVKVLSY